MQIITSSDWMEIICCGQILGLSLLIDTLQGEDFSTQDCLWTNPCLSFSSTAQKGPPAPLPSTAESRNDLTRGDEDVGPDAEPGEDECPRLALPPAHPVHQHVHDHLGWDLDGTKDKLGQVDAEPKACQVHAHAVIGEGDTKPAGRGWRWGPGRSLRELRGEFPPGGDTAYHTTPEHREILLSTGVLNKLM